jgi:hypothetical protein
MFQVVVDVVIEWIGTLKMLAAKVTIVIVQKL